MKTFINYCMKLLASALVIYLVLFVNYSTNVQIILEMYKLFFILLYKFK